MIECYKCGVFVIIDNKLLKLVPQNVVCILSSGHLRDPVILLLFRHIVKTGL